MSYDILNYLGLQHRRYKAEPFNTCLILTGIGLLIFNVDMILESI